MFKNAPPPAQIMPRMVSPDSSLGAASQDPKRSTGKIEAEFTAQEVCIFD